jgi:uncharacterized C2H2 Zn-finger protein
MMRRSMKAEILVKEENKTSLQAGRWKTVYPRKRRQTSFHLSKIHLYLSHHPAVLPRGVFKEISIKIV